MKKYLLVLISLMVIGLAIPTNATAPFIANPLFLSLYSVYSVVNVVNTTYVGATSYFHGNVTELIEFVAHNSTIKIELYNATTGAEIGCLMAFIPHHLYKYVYYIPQYGSAIFVINFTDSDTFYKIPVLDLHLGVYRVENMSGYNVSCIYEIPIGQLYTLTIGHYVLVNATTFFSKYLNGTQTILQDEKEDIEGFYVLIFVS